jgi:hypothetical protein
MKVRFSSVSPGVCRIRAVKMRPCTCIWKAYEARMFMITSACLP